MFVDLAKPFSKVTWTLRILQTMIASKLAIGNSNATLAIQMCDDTVDGSKILRSPVEVGSLSHYFQGFCTSPMVHDFSHQAPVDWVRLATWHDGVGRLLTIERHKCPFIQSEKKSPLPKNTAGWEEHEWIQLVLCICILDIMKPICIFQKG